MSDRKVLILPKSSRIYCTRDGKVQQGLLPAKDELPRLEGLSLLRRRCGEKDQGEVRLLEPTTHYERAA